MGKGWGAYLSDVLLGSQKALQLHEDLAHRHGAGRTTVSQGGEGGLPNALQNNQGGQSQGPLPPPPPRPPGPALRLPLGSSQARGAQEPGLSSAPPEALPAAREDGSPKAGQGGRGSSDRHHRRQPEKGSSELVGLREGALGLEDWNQSAVSSYSLTSVTCWGFGPVIPAPFQNLRILKVLI